MNMKGQQSNILSVNQIIYALLPYLRKLIHQMISSIVFRIVALRKLYLYQLNTIIKLIEQIDSNPPMDSSSFENFLKTQDLHKFVKNLYKKEITLDNDPIPQKDEFGINFHVQEQGFDCLAGLNLSKHIICAFAKYSAIGSSIKVISYRKKDGLKQSFVLNQIKHNISCMTFMLTVNKDSKLRTEYKLIIGFKEGLVKIINLANKAILTGLRTDIKPIVKIIGGNYQKFKGFNVCLALAEDYHVYFVDTDTAQVLYVLRPNIIMCDSALSIQINQEYSYLMQTTHGGYIIFWSMADILRDFLKMPQREKGKSQQQLQYNLFPVRINHSLAIKGIIWCAFYGNLIALIAKAGDRALLKLVAVNVKADDEFIVLLNYQLFHPQKIACIQIYPHCDKIIIAKSKSNQRYLEQFEITEDLTIGKRVKIPAHNMDAIYQFYLPQRCPIIICRGHNTFGVGYSQRLFQGEQQREQMQVEQDY